MASPVAPKKPNTVPKRPIGKCKESWPMANAMDRMQRHCHNSFKRHTALKRSMTTANKRPPEDSRNASAEREITEWFEVSEVQKKYSRFF